MHDEVKKCVESKDIKGLRYIFVDCLDVDPTFEKYSEDYEYSKKVVGLFEEYKELTRNDIRYILILFAICLFLSSVFALLFSFSTFPFY